MSNAENKPPMGNNAQLAVGGEFSRRDNIFRGELFRQISGEFMGWVSMSPCKITNLYFWGGILLGRRDFLWVLSRL